MIALAAIAVLLALFLFLRYGAAADPKTMTKMARYAAIVALGALSIFFAVTERWAPAVFLAGVAWSLMTGVRLWPAGRPDGENASPPPRAPSAAMTRAEALKVLGLQEGASAEEIRAAHRKLIQQTHPDRGGTDYLAAKINEAKDVLLG